MGFHNKIKYLLLSFAVMFSSESLCLSLNISDSAKNDYYAIVGAERIARNDIFNCIKGLIKKNKNATIEKVRVYNGNIVLEYANKAYLRYNLQSSHICVNRSFF